MDGISIWTLTEHTCRQVEMTSTDDGLLGFLFYVLIVYPMTAWLLKVGTIQPPSPSDLF
jgi:hypothetical protein